MNAVATWQDTLAKSATLFDRSAKGRKQASALLWEGAQTATEEWLTNSDTDVNAENLYAEVLDVLGTPRKGDASKIKTVALAVKNNGLVLSVYPNLSKAYAEANRLTKTVKAQAAEDSAADEAVAAIASTAPKSSSTPEGAALIVLSKGVDEAARLLLDALGTDAAAHRSFMRAIAQEIAGRVPKPAPKPAKVAKPKKAATTAKKAAAKPVASGASKPKPVKKAAAPKVEAPVEDPFIEADGEDVSADFDDLFEEIEGTEPEVAEVEAAPVAPVKTVKPKPVRRGPVRRG